MRKRCVAFEEMAKRMLGCLEDSEDLKVGISELKRTDGNAGRNMFFHHANSPTGKERNRPKDLRNFLARRGGGVYCQFSESLKSLVELERRCQGVMQEVKLLSERQEVL